MRLRKLMLLACLSLFLLTAQSYAAPKVSLSTHHVTVNGKAVSPQAYNIDGYNYFKLRDVACLLNGTASSFEVQWDNAQKAINLLSGRQYTAVGGELTSTPLSSLKVADSTAKVLLDGRAVSIKGYNINGNNYYKIADTASVLGFSVSYDHATCTVAIKSAETPVPVPVFKTGVYRVNVDTYLTLRSGPGTDHEKIGSLSNGTQIVVDGITNGWAHLLAEGNSASRYCSADYLVRVKDYDPNEPLPEPEPEPEPEPQPPTVVLPAVYRVNVDSYLSIRSGPGTNYTQVGRLDKNSEVKIDRLENGWAHILDGGEQYCSADYLVYVSAYTAPSTPEEPEAPEPQPPRTSHLDGRMTIILDPGHGGSDIGAHGGDLDEKHVNFYVAQFLRQYLEQAGCRVIMVRDSLEEGSSLSLRGQVMEEYADSADLFFSIHHNAANTAARGAEVLAQIADQDGGPSKLLAELMMEEYGEIEGLPLRKIVFREGANGDYYYTNRKAASMQITALTSEFCFIDNEEDRQYIDSEEDWQRQARAQYDAIMRYFEQIDY